MPYFGILGGVELFYFNPSPLFFFHSPSSLFSPPMFLLIFFFSLFYFLFFIVRKNLVPGQWRLNPLDAKRGKSPKFQKGTVSLIFTRAIYYFIQPHSIFVPLLNNFLRFAFPALYLKFKFDSRETCTSITKKRGNRANSRAVRHRFMRNRRTRRNWEINRKR